MRRDKVSLLSFLSLFFLVIVGLVPAVAHGEEENAAREKILAVFHPYRQGLSQVAGISPGLTIDKGNWEVAKEVLPPEILKYLQAGDFTITVQETTDTPLREEYIKATLEHYAKVELGEGELKNYVAGLPFPLIDPQDPKAGEKVAWNHRYRDRGNTGQFWPTMELRNSSGGVERTQKFYAAFMHGMHRAGENGNLTQWEAEGILSKQYMRILAPSDVEGSQILVVRYDKDTVADEQWAYDPKTRRVRKVVYNPYEASNGMDFLVEDRAGFSGYVSAYVWKYLGERLVLAPGPVKAAEPTLGGRGKWYPMDPWELRQAMVVEVTPREAHPVYSRRVLYIDRQTYGVLYGLAFDLEGNHRRTFLMVYGHPDSMVWNQRLWVPTNAAQCSIDYQTERAAIFRPHRVLYNEPLEEKMFETGALMRQGK